MRKINEELDLSRETLEIDIDSPVFEGMLKDLNKEIQRAILKVYDREFEVGEISLKLSLEIPEGFETIPKANKYGEVINETYKYRKPIFKHNLTTTFKKTFKNDGGYTDKRDVQLIDGKFVAVPITQPQMSIYDLVNEG